jgi:hypothetical protein
VLAAFARKLTGVVAVFAACALVLAAGSATAAPLDPHGEDWEGLAELVRMAQAELGASSVVVTRDLGLEHLTARDALVLVHPTRDLDADELTVFMRAGGRVVLLDDYGTGDSLLAHFGVRRVPLPQHPAAMLRSNPAFALAEAVGGHRAVQDVSRVATNHATGLSDRGLAPLLVVRGQDEPDVLLGVAGVVGRGRLLAVGDASVAMNSMLRYPGNRALALALLRYAADVAGPGEAPPGPGERSDTADPTHPTNPTGTVYLLANDFRLTGRYGGSSALSDVQRAFRGALEALRHGVSAPAAYAASLVVALAVVVWASVRAGRTHKPTVPRFAREIPVVAQGGVAGHAAVLGSPGAARVLLMLELKSALEEVLATKLGLDRVARADELVARARAAGWLDADGTRALARELANLARYEEILVRKDRRPLARVTESEVAATAQRVRTLIAAVEAATSAPRGRVEAPP